MSNEFKIKNGLIVSGAANINNGTATSTPFVISNTNSSQILARFGDTVYIQDRVNGFADRSLFIIGGMSFNNSAGTPLISSGNYLEFLAPTHFYVSSPNIYLNDTKVYIGTYPHTNTYNLEVQGSTRLNTLTATTVSGYTIQSDRMISTGATRAVYTSSAGTVFSSSEVVDQWLYDGTTITNLELSTSWTEYGIYTGSTISNTYRGQMHSDDNYLYIAIADNTWRRTIFG